MNNTPPKFNFRNTPASWRVIDLRLTKIIAHRCTTGVDFQGCSKSEVIEGVAKPHGYGSDAVKFVAMMNEAAKFLPRMKEAFDSEVSTRLKAFELQTKEP